MKAFVIGGLNSLQEKKKAEAILKKMGYVDRGKSTRGWRYKCDFIKCKEDGFYTHHKHDCDQTPITLEELQAMATPYPKEMMVWNFYEEQAQKQLVVAKVEHDEKVAYIINQGGFLGCYNYAKPIEEELTHEERIQRLEDELKKLKI